MPSSAEGIKSNFYCPKDLGRRERLGITASALQEPAPGFAKAVPTKPQANLPVVHSDELAELLHRAEVLAVERGGCLCAVRVLRRDDVEQVLALLPEVSQHAINRGRLRVVVLATVWLGQGGRDPNMKLAQQLG